MKRGEGVALPAGWRTVRFGDVVRNVKVDVDPENSGLDRYVAGEHMGTDDLHIRRWGTIGDGYLGPAFHRKFVKGQVLYGSRRTYLRKVAVAEFDGICANTTFVLEPVGEDLLPELLPFIMQTEAFAEHSVKQSKGSVNPYINWKDIAWYEFPLSPLAEQRRIAEILWAADRLEQHDLTVLARLGELKSATIISLLGIESPQERIEIVRGTKTRTVSGWPIHNIASLASPHRKVVQVGPFGSSVSSQHFTESGTVVLKINNITDRGELDLRNLVFISDEHAESLSHYAVQPGDIVTAAQATTGRSALVTSECSRAIISQHLVRVSVDRTKCIPEYLLVCFHSPLILQQIAIVKQKTTRDGLNTDDVENFRIPVPPLQDQEKTVGVLREIDRAVDAFLHRLGELQKIYKALIRETLNQDV